MAIDKLLILQNVKETLQGIRIDNGYRTDVETVEPKIRVWGEGLHERMMPWVGFGVSVTEPKEYLPGSQVNPKMTVQIVAYFTEADPDEQLRLACEIEDDIFGAMLEDPQRGTDDDGINAVDTKWIRTVDDVPDPTVDSDAVRCVVLDFEVEWQRTTARSPA